MRKAPNGVLFTKENAKEMSARAVKKREENRLMRKSLQTTMDMVLRKTIKKGTQIDADEVLSIAEMEGVNMTVQEAIALAQVQKALMGDTQSAIFIRDTLGEKPVEKVETQMTIEDYVKEHKVKF